MRHPFLRITAASMAMLLLSTQILFAGNRSLVIDESYVDFDDASFEAEFAELDNLEAVILEEGLASFDDVISYQEENQVELINLETYSVNSTQGFDFSNFDWGSALWGFLCCPIGLFVVVFNKDKTSDQKTSYWIGVAAGVLFGSIGGGSYYRL
jgi:hypothetical protein